MEPKVEPYISDYIGQFQKSDRKCYIAIHEYVK